MNRVAMFVSCLVLAAACASGTNGKPDGSGDVTIGLVPFDVDRATHSYDAASNLSSIVAGGFVYPDGEPQTATMLVEWTGDAPVSGDTSAGDPRAAIAVGPAGSVYRADSTTADSLYVEVGARAFSTLKNGPTTLSLSGTMTGPKGEPVNVAGRIIARRK